MDRPRGNRNGEAEIALRREKTAKLMARGFGLSEIAKSLGVSESTAWRYMQNVKADWCKEVRRSTLRPLKQVLAKLDEMESMIWDMLKENPRSDKDERTIKIQLIYALLSVIREANKLVGLYEKELPNFRQQEEKLISKEEFDTKTNEMFKRSPPAYETPISE